MKVCFYVLFLMWMAAGAQTYSAQTKTERKISTPKYGCLPADIKPDTIVEVKQGGPGGGSRLIKETVGQRLEKMKSSCKAGKLRDGKGREIRFYHLQGCWGNPPADSLRILDNQRKEIRKLRKRFAVIEIHCAPSGLMPF